MSNKKTTTKKILIGALILIAVLFAVVKFLPKYFIYRPLTATAFTTCGDNFTDTRDGKVYSTVAIGSQCWFAENINIGTRIDGSSEQTDNSTIEKYCYGDDTANCDTDGGLYQWDEAMQYVTTSGAQGICPTGWHIPTHDEFTTLERGVCTSGSCATDFPYDNSTSGWMGTDEGTSLKSGGSSGFNIVLAGSRAPAGLFQDRGDDAVFFYSTESATDAWFRNFKSSWTSINRGTASKSYGGSVRCLQNTVPPTEALTNFIWVPSLESGTISKINKTTDTVVSTISAGYYSVGVGVDLDSVWIGEAGANNLKRINKNTDVITANIGLPSYPYNVAVDENFVWVTSDTASAVSKIDKDTNSVIATIPVDANPYGIVVDLDSVWVANLSSNEVTRIDKNTDAIITTIPVGTSPYGVTADQNYVWVSNTGSGDISKIDKDTNTVVDTIVVGNNPYSLSVDENYVWVANNGSDSVSKIDKTTDAVVETITGIDHAYGISVDTDFAWVTSNTQSSVVKIDKNINTVLTSIPISGIALSFGDMSGFRYDMFFASTITATLPTQSRVVRRRIPTTTILDEQGGNMIDEIISTSTDNLVINEPITTATNTSTTVSPIVKVETFTRNLTVGSIGDDVKLLQTYLNNHDFMVSSTGPGSKGNETNYYGEKTKQAVKKYQEYYSDEILAPLGLQEGTGFFGEATRNYLNSNY